MPIDQELIERVARALQLELARQTATYGTKVGWKFDEMANAAIEAYEEWLREQSKKWFEPKQSE